MIDLAALSDWFEQRIQSYKRERRVRHAMTLPVIEARIVHASTALTKELRFEIQLSYRFEVADEAAYGSAFSVPLDGENRARTLVAQIAPDATIRVRYNPGEPHENFALAADNPSGPNRLPFDLLD
jgi:hypothetical protein